MMPKAPSPFTTIPPTLGYLIVIFLTLFSYQANASSNSHEKEHHHKHAHETENHYQQESVHTHGQAILTLVLENKQLIIEFHSPAINIVGFEHAPENQEQKQQIEKAIALLEEGNKTLKLNDGNCQIHNSSAKSSFSLHTNQHNHSAEHKQKTHNEFIANYEYSCQQTNRLQSVEALFFNLFPGIEEINTQWIINNKQGASLLRAGSNKLEFK